MKKVYYRRNEEQGGRWEIKLEEGKKWQPRFDPSIGEPLVRKSLMLSHPSRATARYRSPNSHPGQLALPKA